MVSYRDLTEDIDLMIYPESYDLWENKNRWKLHAEETKTSVILGLKDERGAQLAYFYNPESGQSYRYKKHSTADRIAFQDHDWSPENNLQTVDVNGFKVGITLCHDMYLPLLMRYLKQKQEADILVNPSGVPVMRKKWSIILRARAIENNCYTLCTMRHKPHPTNKAHVFGFNPSGDDLLFKDSRTGKRCTIYETLADEIYLGQLSKPPKPVLQKRKSIIKNLEIKRASSKPEIAIEVEVKGEKLEGNYKSNQFCQSVKDGPTEHQCGDESIFILPIKGHSIYFPERVFDLIYRSKEEAKTQKRA
jgi:predicted amidohydrolase